MRPDFCGFLHPHVDLRKCVGCGACEKACPVLHRPAARHPLSVYAAKSKDDELRLKSSSGGMFSLLARQIFAKGGVVYGAAIREKDLMVYHLAAEDEDGLSRLRGSKYVQSEMGDVYRAVRVHLVANRPVMFTGTPCQIAGLRQYLDKEYDNLLCVDVICHAVPSPLAWQKYLEARAVEIKGRGSAPVESFNPGRISFRRKNYGWKRFALSLGFASDEAYLGCTGEDTFFRGFLTELYNRSSCHNCSFRELRSGSDLTIADYWNVHERFPEMDDDKGTSLVLINTPKGKIAYDRMRSNCDERTSDFLDASRVNPLLVRSPQMNGRRALFFLLVRCPLVNFDRLVIKLAGKRLLIDRIVGRLCRMVRCLHY